GYGVRPGSGARDRGRARLREGPRKLPPASGGARRPAHEARTHGRGTRRAGARGFAHEERARAGAAAGTRGTPVALLVRGLPYNTGGMGQSTASATARSSSASWTLTL